MLHEARRLQGTAQCQRALPDSPHSDPEQSYPLTHPLKEKLLAEHEASVSASESKLAAAAAERRAAEARAEGLKRELASCEGRLEESARLLASNQQVIKWLNKELNDAQMLPGTTGAAAGVAGAGIGAGFGGGLSSGLGEGFGTYNFESFGVDEEVGVNDAELASKSPAGDLGGGGRKAMFTAGLRESLTGGADKDAYFSYRGEPMGEPVGGEVRGGGVVEGTPDHAGRGGDYRVGRGGYSRIVTPESAGVSDPTQGSSRFLSKDGGNGEVGRRIGGDSIRSIPAF